MTKHRKPPLIQRLPRGVREQPAWIFIGVLFIVVGFGYIFQWTHSSVAEVVGTSGLRVWGVFLAATGFFLITALIKGSPALEKLSLRVLTCNLLVYCGWLVVSVPFNRAVSTVVLAIALCSLTEFRVLYLKALMKQAEAMNADLKAAEDNE